MSAAQAQQTPRYPLDARTMLGGAPRELTIAEANTEGFGMACDETYEEGTVVLVYPHSGTIYRSPSGSFSCLVGNQEIENADLAKVEAWLAKEWPDVLAPQYQPGNLLKTADRADVNVNALANEFSRVLHEWLTPAQMLLVRMRNARREHPDVCHSHDFCDANMAMDEAITRLSYGPLALDDDRQIAVWNAAWKKAKADEFAYAP